MTNVDNRLNGTNFRVFNLGVLQAIPRSWGDRVGPTDIEDLRRFQLVRPTRLALNLTGNVTFQIYTLRPRQLLPQVLSRVGGQNFSRIPPALLNANLRFVRPAEYGNLAAGFYFVRVLRRQGDTPYRVILRPTPLPPPRDRQAPSATLTPVTPPSDGTTLDFTVTYTDNFALNNSTIGNGDIRVIGPNGFNQAATLVALAPSGNSTTRTALYRITSPAGPWNSLNSGNYSILLQPGQVSDTSGNAMAAATLGSFTVDIPSSFVQASVRPNETRVNYVLDFSKTTDADSRPGLGLFRRAVPFVVQDLSLSTRDFEGGTTFRSGITVSVTDRAPNTTGTPYQTGDLVVSRITVDGGSFVAYRTLLVDPATQRAAMLQLRIRATQVNPDDLLSLKRAMESPDRVSNALILSFISVRPNATGLYPTFSLFDQPFPSEDFSPGVSLPFGWSGSRVSDIPPNTAYRLNSTTTSFAIAPNAPFTDVLGNLLNNTIIGNSAENQIDSSWGDDFLVGGAGDDQLQGGDGNDRLEGGDGDDILNGFQDFTGATANGGAGQIDTLIGGLGSDTFELNLRDGRAAYVEEPGDGYALIVDMQIGIDKIRLPSSAFTATGLINTSRYQLEVRAVAGIGTSALDTEIYFVNGTVRDRIAIVQDQTGLRANGNVAGDFLGF